MSGMSDPVEELYPTYQQREAYRDGVRRALSAAWPYMDDTTREAVERELLGDNA